MVKMKVIFRNRCRIIPDGLCAEIDLQQLKTLPIFTYIKNAGNIEEQEMLSTFNCGVGLLLVVDQEHAREIAEQMKQYHDCSGKRGNRGGTSSKSRRKKKKAGNNLVASCIF